MTFYHEDKMRRTRFLFWLDGSQGFVDVDRLYEDLGVSLAVKREDLKRLEDEGFIRAYFEGGGSANAELLSHGRDEIARLTEMRMDRAQRGAACRSALLQYLYRRGATGDAGGGVTWTAFLDDETSNFFGDPFTEAEVGQQAARLQQQGLIDGINTGQAEGPVRFLLTSDGQECVEDHHADLRAWQQARRGAQGTAATYHNTFNGAMSGNVQVATGPGSAQNITSGVGTEGLIHIIEGAFDLARRVVTDEEAHLWSREAEDEAVNAVQQGDTTKARRLLERLRDGLQGVVKTEANAALTAFGSWGVEQLIHTLPH